MVMLMAWLSAVWESPGLASSWGHANRVAEDQGVGRVNPPECCTGTTLVEFLHLLIGVFGCGQGPGGHLLHIWSWCIHPDPALICNVIVCGKHM